MMTMKTSQRIRLGRISPKMWVKKFYKESSGWTFKQYAILIWI